MGFFRAWARLASLCIAALTVLLAAQAHAQDSVIGSAIKEQLEQRYNGGQNFVTSFYEDRAFEPAWTTQKNIEAAFRIIESVYEDGLSPEDFQLSQLRALQAAGQTHILDVALTENIAWIGHILRNGKLDREDYANARPVRGPAQDFDFTLSMSMAIGNIERLIDDQRPKLDYYTKLRALLGTYRAIAMNGGWPTVPPGKTLRKGDTANRVMALRKRLSANGHLLGSAQPSSVFDDAVETAVKQFQSQHGIAPDGAVGPATLAALNVPAERRIDQIRVNMERARWMGRMPKERSVIVNIAGYYAAVIEGKNVLWSTRVIVGREYTSTPVFVDEMETIEFNPTWTVPRSITRKSLAPKIIANPGYLAQQDYYLAKANGSEIDPATVDFASLSPTNFPYWIVQRPGQKNALGQVKFLFPNAYSVYMHDTPNRTLFDRTGRTFSHGCVRTENPLDLAAVLLKAQGWDAARIADVVASGKRTRVALETKIPVAILYWTVDLAGNQIQFFEDIYDRDDALLKALDAPLRAQ